MSVPNTAPGGRHIHPNRMIIRFPADLTPSYFGTVPLGVKAPVVQPGLLKGNDWLLLGPRQALASIADKVTAMTDLDALR